jgi:transposase
MKHLNPEYKLAIVKYYFKNNETMDDVCKIFNCKKSSLMDWIKQYEQTKNLTRRNRKPISYKISNEQVKTALEILNKNEQTTMDELVYEMKRKYDTFDITPQHLGKIVRDNNRTRKRTRHEHYPATRYNKPTNKSVELENFYNEVRKYPIDKIICLDETSVGSHLKPSYSRCYLGKRCVIKTNNNFVFRSFTLLVAINNSKCVGKIFYEKGGTTKERMVEFLETQIFPKYKNHLIILDNAGSHNNELVKDSITKSGNKYLFSIPYTPKTNHPIEAYFNQIKTYLKKQRNVNSFMELEKNIETAVSKVKPDNYRNYFHYAYEVKQNIPFTKNKSTKTRKRKNYKS